MIFGKRDERMETKNSTDTMEIEALKSFRTMLEEHSVKTSSILYHGEAGPYFLAMKMTNGQEVFYGYEVTHAADFRANPEKTAAEFSNADFIFDAIRTMNLPAADRSFETLSLHTRKIIVSTEDNPHDFVDFLRKRPKLLESTIVFSLPWDGRTPGSAAGEKASLH